MKSKWSSLPSYVSLASIVVLPFGSVLADAEDPRSGGGLDAAMPSLDLSAAAAYGASGAGLSSLLGAGALGADDAAWSRTLGFEAGVGFTADPDAFLMAFQVDFFLLDEFSLGPLIQLGVSDTVTIFAPTLNLQYVFDLPWQELEALKPTAQFGLGFAYLHKDHRQGRDDDVGFLVNFGFGADYYLTSHVALGTNFLFNFLPHETLYENFFFTWEVLTIRYQF